MERERERGGRGSQVGEAGDAAEAEGQHGMLPVYKAASHSALPDDRTRGGLTATAQLKAELKEKNAALEIAEGQVFASLARGHG